MCLSKTGKVYYINELIVCDRKGSLFLNVSATSLNFVIQIL